jgi:hypothetical protein
MAAASCQFARVSSSRPVLLPAAPGPPAAPTGCSATRLKGADGGTSEPSQATSAVTPHAPSGPEPSNDNFANAQVIIGTSGSVAGTNVGATVEPGEPAMSAGLTLYIKFDGYNENGSNANPPYEGPFSLEWALQS